MRILVIFLLLSVGVSASEVSDAISELSAKQFAAREAGMQRLVRLADTNHETVLRECMQTYRQVDDPEVKVRLRSAMQQIVDKYLYRTPRGFLGLRMNNVIINNGGKVIINNVTMPSSGVWVSGIVENSAAEKAGIQANDFVIAVDGKADLNSQEFTKYIQSNRPGTAVKLSVVRGAATNELDVVLGELPQEVRDQLLTEEGGRAFFKSWMREQSGGAVTNTVPGAK